MLVVCRLISLILALVFLKDCMLIISVTWKLLISMNTYRAPILYFFSSESEYSDRYYHLGHNYWNCHLHPRVSEWLLWEKMQIFNDEDWKYSNNVNYACGVDIQWWWSSGSENDAECCLWSSTTNKCSLTIIIIFIIYSHTTLHICCTSINDFEWVVISSTMSLFSSVDASSRSVLLCA